MSRKKARKTEELKSLMCRLQKTVDYLNKKVEELGNEIKEIGG